MQAPTLAQITHRLEHLDPNAKALWGKMNLAQMLVHCRMPIEAGLGERTVSSKGNFFTRWLLFPLLMKIPWPKGKAQTHTDFNVVNLNMPVRSAQEEAAALVAKVKAFVAGGFSPKTHPILQRKHLDHHLRQFGA
jgi:hypothetical protein